MPNAQGVSGSILRSPRNPQFSCRVDIGTCDIMTHVRVPAQPRKGSAMLSNHGTMCAFVRACVHAEGAESITPDIVSRHDTCAQYHGR
jgi:hypothetical protein